MKQPIFQDQQTQALNALLSIISQSDEFLSCYLTGSYAEGYAVSPDVSDIDLTIVSQGALTEDMQRRFDRLVAQTLAETGVDLDISVIEAASETPAQGNVKLSYLGIAFREAALSAKLSGKLIWGEDILAQVPLPSAEEYLRETKEIPFEFSNRIRGYKGLEFPLSYPDENDDFYGYLRMDETPAGAQPNEDKFASASTKPLISLMTWLGTATAAQIDSTTMVGNKNQCIKALSNAAPDKGEELSYIFDKCRRQWGYKVPEQHADRQELRRICRRALDWENDYRNQFFPSMTMYQR